jgi:tRNA nucleotidyltransferase (CCA-adding enzyme)
LQVNSSTILDFLFSQILVKFLSFTDLYLNLSEQQLASVPASVLSPETWPFDLKWLPPSTYLVGGNVRDALLGRHAEYLDLDFVMPERVVETAKAIARHYGAGFVLLDAERQIARVVFEHATADFAQQVGPSLETDLQRRDFTVNAIAYNPITREIIDPLGGCEDLRQRLIRMVAPENLKEDPLRLLRAYRQAAQLGFELEPDTQSAIQHLVDLLQFIAAERVQAELNYLLSTASGTPFLTLAWRDGLLQHWLPYTTATSLTLVERIDHAAIALEGRWPSFSSELSGWVRDQQKASGASRSWLKIAKLASITAPDPQTAEQELWRLKYSRTEVQAVLTVIKFVPQLQADVAHMPLRDQYFLFQGVGSAFPALAVLAVGLGLSLEAIAPLVQRFLTPNDPVAHPVLPVTGRDLMTALQLPAGPQIGHLLQAIQLAQAEDKIVTTDDALNFAQQLLNQ